MSQDKVAINICKIK